MRIALLALAGCVLALLAAGIFYVHALSHAQQAATEYADANRPQLIDLDDRPVDWHQWHAGEIVVAIFTRSDCPISNRYAPEVRRLHEAFHSQGVEFCLVYVDPREQPAAIRAHLAEYAYPCSALRDPEHKLVAVTGASVTPEAVVFDANRQITYRGRIDNLNDDLGASRSAPTTHDLADAIEATLAGRPVAEPVTKAVGCYIEDLN